MKKILIKYKIFLLDFYGYFNLEFFDIYKCKKVKVFEIIKFVFEEFLIVGGFWECKIVYFKSVVYGELIMFRWVVLFMGIEVG